MNFMMKLGDWLHLPSASHPTASTSLDRESEIRFIEAEQRVIQARLNLLDLEAKVRERIRRDD